MSAGSNVSSLVDETMETRINRSIWSPNTCPGGSIVCADDGRESVRPAQVATFSPWSPDLKAVALLLSPSLFLER
jgi:hypothetical protein